MYDDSLDNYEAFARIIVIGVGGLIGSFIEPFALPFYHKFLFLGGLVERVGACILKVLDEIIAV